MQLTPAAFVTKWAARFANNDDFLIAEADMREFATDIADSFGVTVANVPLYQAGVTYAVAALVRYELPSQAESFFYALKAGKLPAPSGVGDTNWKVVPGPVKETELSQALTLVQAQGLDGTSVKAGRTFLIDFGLNAQGATQTITVRGVSNDRFDVEGTLEVNGTVTAVTNIDVQAGTWQVKQYSTGYTDAQARAAQLGRVAPSGTTTVTLTSESPTHYGRAASGTFSVDATNCAVGQEAYFSLGPGATAPQFTAAPPGQPYAYEGATYASGQAFSYTLHVDVDKIIVVILPAA